jgi:mono/diheme cytochrome c family protein
MADSCNHQPGRAWRARIALLAVITLFIMAPDILLAQQAAPPTRPNPYARKAVDPALAEQGKNLFSVRCAFCHGSDARGGESGPNLMRSSVVLNDEDGEKIGEVVLHGRPQQGMPPFDVSAAQIKQLAGFLHSLPVSGNERKGAADVIPVGDATAGAKEFQAKCASCHSPTGDLKGIGSRVKKPRELQQSWLMPGMRGGDLAIKAPGKTVAVTTDGVTVRGELVRIDDFMVRMKTEDGRIISFNRSGNSMQIVVTDPMRGHLDLLPKYRDTSIHDITAYLVSIK